MAREVWTEILTSFSVLEPRDWATIIPLPTEMPWAKDMNRLIRAVLEPTAARALLPT